MIYVSWSLICNHLYIFKFASKFWGSQNAAGLSRRRWIPLPKVGGFSDLGMLSEKVTFSEVKKKASQLSRNQTGHESNHLVLFVNFFFYPREDFVAVGGSCFQVGGEELSCLAFLGLIWGWRQYGVSLILLFWALCWWRFFFCICLTLSKLEMTHGTCCSLTKWWIMLRWPHDFSICMTIFPKFCSYKSHAGKFFIKHMTHDHFVLP